MITGNKILLSAYAHCMAITKSHYENFPVASMGLNKPLRRSISVVYAFARTADDFADEGQFSKEQRLHSLEKYFFELQLIEQHLGSVKPFIHTSDNPIFIALADVLQNYQIPLNLFQDLLRAFTQDINKTRYENFDEVLAYCKHSANPVGRILLYLNKSASEENMIYSDAICTGLQLINFFQDISQDLEENDRLYLPLDEMDNFGVTVDDLKKQVNNPKTQSFIEFQLNRTSKLYQSGKPLCFKLSGRFAFEIRLIFAGGSIILEKLKKNTFSIYRRPRLSGKDKFKIFARACFPSK